MNTKNNKENKNGIKNIDEKHTDIMNTFLVLEKDTIPKLSQEKNSLKKRIKYLENNAKQYTDEYFEIQDTIEDIREEIRNLKMQKKNIY